jgi:hypothetical protein
MILDFDTKYCNQNSISRKMQTTIEVEGKTPKSCILITLGTRPAMISHYSFIPTFWPQYDDATVEAIIK